MGQQVNKLQRQFAELQAAAVRSVAGNAAEFNRLSENINKIRTQQVDLIKSTGDYEVRTVKALTATEEFSRAIGKQKVGLVEGVKNFKMLNAVAKEQIDIQRAMAVAWSKDSSGKVVSDLIIPKDAVSRTQAFRTQIGVYNQALASVSDNTIKWGKNTQWAGRQMMLGFTLPMGVAAAATGKIAYDMDKALTNITKVYGDASQKFQDSTEQIRSQSTQTARNMASLYGQSASDTLDITAQFAAAGKTGTEIQQATAAATKARTLNEMDLQTAIQASISMQTVYGYSAEQIGQKWDYINAVSNQTILSADDFAVAIPKVAGLFKDLGADIEDVGVLMTAMKAGGIEAAEGANALKTISFRAVAPYGKGMETFKKATGTDLKQIVSQANGQIMPLLDLMISKMQGLDAATKTQVFKDVFGIYQGNKALVLMEQIANKGEQVSQAIAVGKNSIAENAMIANQELQRMNAQPFKKIEKAVERIKIEMAAIGEVVLPVVATVVNAAADVIKFINGLDSTKKAIVLGIAAIVALAGPVIMIVGLFANLVGNIGKAGTVLGALVTRFKMLTPEQRAQEILAKRAASGFDAQTSAVARITQAIERMNAQMIKDKSISLAQDPVLNRRNLREDKNGNLIDSRGKRIKMAEQEAVFAARAADSEERRASAVDRQARARNAAMGVSGAATGAGVIGTTINIDGVLGKASDTLITFGLISSIMPGLTAKVGGFFASGISKATQFAGKIGGVKAGFSGLGAGLASAASSMALPLTAAAVAIGAFWMKAKQDAQEAADKVKAVAESSQTWADTLGYNSVDPGTMAKQAQKNGTDITKALAVSIRQNDAGIADAINGNSGKSIGEKWAIAINEGVKVKLSGGTTDAAKQATRVALEIMGQSFRDADFESQVNVKVNFDTGISKATAEGVAGIMQDALDDEGSGFDKFAREWLSGQNDLTASGKESAEAAADIFHKAYMTADARKRDEFMSEIVRQQSTDLRNAYKTAYDKMNGGFTYEEFVKAIQSKSGGARKINGKALSIVGEDESAKMIKIGDATRTFTTELASSIGVMGQIGNNPTIEEIQAVLARNNKEINEGAAAGNNAAQGIKETKNAAQDLKTTLSQFGITMDVEKVESTYRSVMEGVQGAMFDFGDQAWEQHSDNVMSALERRADRSEANFDKRSDRMEVKHDAAQDRITKNQESRSKGIEKTYDTRLKRIQDLIKAEQDAENARQKAFEADQRRMQRYSAMFSKNVDLNAAISTGNIDEAAKIVNDMQSQSVAWSSEDADIVARSASEKRIAGIEKQQDKIEAQKKSRLDALKAVEDAEDKALEASQKREKDRLTAARNADKGRIESSKKAAQAKIDRDRRAIEIELATIRAYVPRNNAEMVKQKNQIDAAYRQYGVKLTGHGRSWSNIIGTSMKSETAKAAAAIKSEIAWASIGKHISDQLLRGGFGMTSAQFAAWIGGAPAPAGTIFNPGKGKANTAAQPKNGGRRTSGGSTAYHTGGIVGKDKGGRTGYAGKNLAQSEVMINALKGEAILNRKATDFIGEENVSAINSGKLPENTGPWGPAVGIAGMAAAIQGAAVKKVMEATVNAVKTRLSTAGGAMDYGMNIKGGPGTYGGIKINADQIKNAATIMSVGKSMGASIRDLQISLMTAMQESTLRNINYGDRDSVGLFQQRPSQGWGTVAQIMDPKYSSRKFFEGLLRIKGRNSMALTEAAQAVQRSAFPNAYAKWEAMAKAIVAGGTVTTGAGSSGYNGFAANANITGLQGAAGGQLPVGTGVTPGGWFKPARGRVSSEFGMRTNPVTGVYKLHGGIDIAAPTGTPTYAAKGGVVTMADYYKSLGNYIRINHGGGVETGYAHLSRFNTRVGASVRTGQHIGAIGSTGNSTGPHLHFEYRKGGTRINPRQIIPQFMEGGHTLSSGIAMLHPKETVLSKPLSQDLKVGIDKFATDGGTQSFSFDLRGATISSEVELEKTVRKAVSNALDEKDRRAGRSRRIGDKS